MVTAHYIGIYYNVPEHLVVCPSGIHAVARVGDYFVVCI